jgi:glycosyltransferase involved in cell wall biosynthesis
MDTSDYLAECAIAIVKHTYTPTGGAEQELLRYLRPRAKAVAYISHPFPDARGVPLNSAITLFERGERTQDFLAPLVKGPAPISFAKDMLFTLWYLSRLEPRFQIYIGVDNLNARSGLLLRRLGTIRRVIYYVIDYAPHRFSHRLGQALYRMLDRTCCYGADAVWNVSAAMEEARRDDGIEPSRCAPQIEVPLGNRYYDAPRVPYEEIDPNLIIFLGSLRPEQGLDTMIRAMPRLRRTIPEARLRVIGGGPESTSLKRLAAEQNVSDAIEFLGFVEDDSRVAELVADGALGIAPYARTSDTYKRFADPGKVKIYLAAGLPVVITRVPRIAALVEDCGAGVVIEPDPDCLADMLASLLSSPDRIRELRENAARLGKRFDWDTVFDRAFGETLERWHRQG